MYISEKHRFMQEAIRLSIETMTAGQGGPFGAVVVRNNEIIAYGSNQVLSTNDPTAHAEVVAIRNASRELKRFELNDCELYTSCEPCPMCLGAIYWAKIQKVYYANTQEDAAAIGFDDAFIYKEMQRPINQRQTEMVQLLPDEAKEAFIKWQQLTDKKMY